MPDNQNFPFPTQDVDGALNRAAEVGLHVALRAYKIVRTSNGRKQSYTISLWFACRQKPRLLEFWHEFQENDSLGDHHDSDYGRERKCRKNCFAGSGEKRSETSR